MKAIVLEFHSPLRIGGIKGFESSSNFLHSDTIFGAICSALSYLGEDVSAFASRAERGEIKLSSAFPYIGETLYFPPPMVRPFYSGEDFRDFFRSYKKSFIEEKGFRAVIEGRELEGGDNLRRSSDFWVVENRPGVSLDRVSRGSNLYFYSTIRFKEDAGLFYLVECTSGDFEKFVKPALRLLEDEGLGGNRSSGEGNFSFKVRDVDFKTMGSYNVCLSLSFIRRDNLISYELIKRSGYIFSRSGEAFLKPLFLMVKEGSVVAQDEGEVLRLSRYYPELMDKLGHEVYVYGKCFGVEISEKYFGERRDEHSGA